MIDDPAGQRIMLSWALRVNSASPVDGGVVHKSGNPPSFGFFSIDNLTSGPYLLFDMAELSLVSSVAGVISLGLTVCQGLVTYSSRFKSFHDETGDVATKAKGLEIVLKAISDLISNPDAFNNSSSIVSERVKTASQCLLDCKQGLVKLKSSLDEVTRDCSSGKSHKAKQYLERFLYPLRRGSLVGRVDTIEGLQSNLEMALSSLRIAMDIDGKIENDNRMQSLAISISNIAADTGKIDGLEQIIGKMEEKANERCDKMV
ncbi:hypothetical protein N7540_009136 [Penicillium herquei]|nr:hypothetical protein N7540_009136 [Penicillium herquei]